MPRIYQKIKDPQNEARAINENFDRVSLDIADRSGSFSSTAIATSVGPTPAGRTLRIQVNLLDMRDIYTINRMPVIGRITVYVDNDGNGEYIWPFGGGLSEDEKHNISVSCYQSRIVLDEVPNEKGTYVIAVRNDDSSPHQFYVHIDTYYVPSPEEGVARRAI